MEPSLLHSWILERGNTICSFPVAIHRIRLILFANRRKLKETQPHRQEICCSKSCLQGRIQEVGDRCDEMARHPRSSFNLQGSKLYYEEYLSQFSFDLKPETQVSGHFRSSPVSWPPVSTSETLVCFFIPPVHRGSDHPKTFIRLVVNT